MDFTEYLIKVSTYRPHDLDFTDKGILSIYARSKSKSVYQVLQELKSLPVFAHRKGMDYKNIHTRVKRLAEYKFLEQLKEYFERGAKHYKISDYGLLTYIDQIAFQHSMKHLAIIKHKESLLFRSILFQFFDEKTIESMHPSMSEDLEALIYEYVRKSCHDTSYSCGILWRDINDSISTLPHLPKDEILQQYMLYLGGKSIPNQQHVLREIKEYEKRMTSEQRKEFDLLARQLTEGDSRKRDWPQAPYPIGYIYSNMFVHLRKMLEDNIKTLTFHIISYVGSTITSKKQTENDLWKKFEDTDSLVSNILTDKKFAKLIESIKNDFDVGAKQFAYFSKLERPKERVMKKENS